MRPSSTIIIYAHDDGRGGINRVCDLIKAIQVPLLIYLATAASL
jgi:hypothetical protein